MKNLEFIHELRYDSLPDQVKEQILYCLLDLCASLIAGRHTQQSRIVHEFATLAHGGQQASLLLDGRNVSPSGAALATGMTIDSFDIHDSHRHSQGHAGVHIFASLLAICEYKYFRESKHISPTEFLATMVMAYDIACRAGAALHATVNTYPTSGSWGAVSSAAIYARLFQFNAEQTRHALGIAEYHGPRSEMMRCIDHPTMLKDGSGWGALCGVSAGMLAEAGYTGAPAITIEAEKVSSFYDSLGTYYSVMEQGFKPHGSCWWAQPAIEAALYLMKEHPVDPTNIRRIDVITFEKATHLNTTTPKLTDEAQYSLPFPVAAAIMKGANLQDGEWYGLGPQNLLESKLNSPELCALAQKVRMKEDPELTKKWPDKILARINLTLTNGQVFESPEMTFRGELENPLSRDELKQKFHWLAETGLSNERAKKLEQLVLSFDEQPGIEPLLDLLRPEMDKAHLI